MIRFSCSCVPVAQPRQRHRAFQVGDHTRVSNYTPTRHPVNAYKAALQLAAKQVHPGPPLNGPLSLDLTILMPRPGRLRWKKREMPRLWHDVKPDDENILKSTQDALSGVCWHDDAQVASVVLRKLYASGSESPGVEVCIDVLDGVSP